MVAKEEAGGRRPSQLKIGIFGGLFLLREEVDITHLKYARTITILVLLVNMLQFLLLLKLNYRSFLTLLHI